MRVKCGITGARRALKSIEHGYETMHEHALPILYELQDRRWTPTDSASLPSKSGVALALFSSASAGQLALHIPRRGVSLAEHRTTPTAGYTPRV